MDKKTLKQARDMLKAADARGMTGPKVDALRAVVSEAKAEPEEVTRRCRFTGTWVTACTAEQAGVRVEDGLKWFTVCETHGFLVGHPTKALALSWMASPEGFCERCQKINKGELPKFTGPRGKHDFGDDDKPENESYYMLGRGGSGPAPLNRRTR